MSVRIRRFTALAAVLLASASSACATRSGPSAAPSPGWTDDPAAIEAAGDDLLRVSQAAIDSMNPVAHGDTVRGALSPDDPIIEKSSAHRPGSRYRLASFAGRRGERVVVSVASRDFDSYLLLGRRIGERAVEVIDFDDDGGDGTDARLRAELPRDGQYVIVTTTYSPDEVGGYTLALAPFDGPVLDPVEELVLAPDIRERLRPVTRGTVANGELTTSSDRIDDDGHRYEAWTLTADEGERLRIELASKEFDTYLYVGVLDRDGRLWAVARDDDGGADTNSYLTFDPPSAGDYTILATSYFVDETGRYSLEVDRWTGDPFHDRLPPAVVADARSLRPGGEVRGTIRANDPTLDEGHRYDLWRYESTTDAEATIDLRSPDFDSYLMVLGVDGDAPVILAEDDDGGGGLDSSLTLPVEAGRSYLVLVRGYGVDALGDYTLSLETGPRE
ncbi:MAG: PPC domain-containing protein [Gemmatimonadota bacterium]